MGHEPGDDWAEEAQSEYEAELGARYLKELGHDLYREHFEQAVAEFTADRLQSYYLHRPDMAGAAIRMMERATGLQEMCPSGALLFATSAIEITIKHLLVRPIVNGLVHTEAVADVVMALTPEQTGSDAFKRLTFGILKKIADLDLVAYKRSGANRILWDEWKQLQKQRNDLIHDGTQPSESVMATAIPVAAEFLNVLFPAVLKALGLAVNGCMMIQALPKWGVL